MIVIMLAALPIMGYAGDGLSTDYDMSYVTAEVLKYRIEYKQNRKAVKTAVKNYSVNLVRNIGMSESHSRLVVGVLGFVGGLATNKNLRMKLNDSKTLGLELKNPVADNRVLFLNYRLRW